MSDAEVDGQEMALLLQGALMMGAMQFTSVKFGVMQQPVRIEQPKNSEGIYEPYFRVHLASGAIVRVSFKVDPADW